MTGRPSEFEFIDTMLAPLAAGYAGALGLGDDAAVIDVRPGYQLAITKDALVAGVHFFSDDPPEDIAAKMLRVNLSDLAAMGARPIGYLTALMLPDWIDREWLERFVAGLAADQRQFDVHLVGGDTASTPGPLALTVTAFGDVRAGQALLRSGARPGDRVVVSGTIGDGALGLAVIQGRLTGLSDPDRQYLIGRYRRPRPRVGLGLALAGVASAAIDVSDGLIADLGHICARSNAGARIRAQDLPLSPAARAALDRDPDLIETVLTGGDDYELCLAVPAARRGSLPALASGQDAPLTDIGEIVTGAGVVAIGKDGRGLRFKATGFRHF